jgi:hypothetical protein
MRGKRQVCLRGLFDIVNPCAVFGPIQLAVSARLKPATGARQSETPGPKSTADFWAGVWLLASERMKKCYGHQFQVSQIGCGYRKGAKWQKS